MKENFKEYHINEYLDEIYSNAIIVLDTNSILNLYRYSEENRIKFFEILKKVESRLYLTNQICCEFYKNRLIIIENRSTFKESINELIAENISKLTNIIKNCSGADKYNSALSILKHEVELKESLIKELNKVLKNTTNSINEFKQNFDINYIQSKDPILDEFVKIIDNKVSNEISEGDKSKIFTEGEVRYKDNIPPGYKDNDKGTPEKFGDLIIWNELQELSKNNNKPILFISDDRKEDWAIKFKGYDLGPRKELIKEFYNNTKHLFYSVTTTKFIQIISESYKVEDVKKLQEETENIQKNIQQKEIDLKKKIKLRKEYIDLIERNNSIHGYKNKLDFVEKINSNPLDEYNKSMEILENLKRNPLDEYNKSMEILENLKRNPLDEYNKSMEILEKLKRDPLDKYNNSIEILKKLKSNPLEDYQKSMEYLDKINKSKNKDI